MTFSWLMRVQEAGVGGGGASSNTRYRNMKLQCQKHSGTARQAAYVMCTLVYSCICACNSALFINMANCLARLYMHVMFKTFLHKI